MPARCRVVHPDAISAKSCYALRVRIVLLILATLALAVPIRWVAAGACGSGGNQISAVAAIGDESPTRVAFDCCGREIPTVESDSSAQEPGAPGGEPTHEPCDDCGCPLRCCLGSLTVPLGVPPTIEIGLAGSIGTIPVSITQAEPAPPNLLGLKRPPRFRAAT